MAPSLSPSGGGPIRVLLADDHEPTRGGLRRHLERCSRIAVAGEAAGGPEALHLVDRVPGAVLLLDVDMQQMNGLDVMRRLHERTAPVRVLGLSNYSEPTYVFEMLAYGAAGYLSKEDALDVIVDGVCRAADGERCVLSPSVWAILCQAVPRVPGGPPVAERLGRGYAVARLVAAGYPDAQIAVRLGMAQPDVEAAVARLCAALALRERAELVAWGWGRGLVEPPSCIRNEHP